MAKKLVKKDNRYIARTVTEDPKPCAFCLRKVDDELNYGKLYAIGDIQCHYFCALLSCCLVQNGPEETGLFGFLYKDILAELERCKKHRCSYCGQGGASLGCCVAACRKQFHLPCGRQKQAVSLFYGTFKSFCKQHAPKQKIPDRIMTNAKLRMKQARNGLSQESASPEMVCVICYEPVDGFPTLNTFWPPCCARDAWFHRTCLQRMALSAGMHYLKCPLCNDKETFYDSVVSQGYYVPDRDAAWELEQNAFSEIYERPVTCSAEPCECPLGRNHDAENGPWDIKLCLLCGSVGRHLQCGSETFVCPTCQPVAPTDLDKLAETIDAVIQQELAAAAAANRHGPVMPSRMSLRRTKSRNLNRPSCSRINTSRNDITETDNTTSSRLELNLKTPKKELTPKKNAEKSLNDQEKVLTRREHTLKDQESLFKERENIGPFSPSKKTSFEQCYLDKFSPSKLLQSLEEQLTDLDDNVVDKLRKRMKKPRPLSVKKRIVNDTLDNILKRKLKENKQKEVVKQWCSPKKHVQPTEDKITPKKSTPLKQTVTPSKKGATTLTPIKIDQVYDESSNSTFVLPSEFIADVQSDDSFTHDTPKRKTIEIKHDSSLEIFEKDHSISIDMIKMDPEYTSNKYSDFDKISKQSPLSADYVDVENFKKVYLNEIGLNNGKTYENQIKIDPVAGLKLSCSQKFNEMAKYQTEKDLKRKETKKRGKRRLSEAPKEKDNTKKRKMSENDLILQYSSTRVNNIEPDSKKASKKSRKHRKKKTKKSNKNLKLTLDSTTKNKRNKLKTRLSINNKNIKLKIKWKKEQLHLKLESKTEKRKKLSGQPKIEKSPKLTQYLLQFPNESGSHDILVKPEEEIKMKRKYIKLEKSPDKFKQMSLHNFFKVK